MQDFIRQNPSIKSVTDVGCAHGRMLRWLKNISNLELVNCIDSDLPTLEDNLEYTFQPNLYDMLFGRNDSDKRLDIKVYHGDIVIPDDRLKADCFTMVEMIEHVPLEHLEKVCQTVFGYYQPRFIIVTTPNSEFNPLLRVYAAAQKAKRELQEQQKLVHEQQKDQQAQQTMQEEQAQLPIQEIQSSIIGELANGQPQPQLQQNQNEFRHRDHKFEWNRSEFKHWTQKMCKSYPYEVFLSGVGELPGSESLGPCTQIALFRHLADGASEASDRISDPTLCFDLFMNKLSVQEQQPEFMGDPTLRKVCLRAEYHIPGKPVFEKLEEATYSSSLSDTQDEEMPMQAGY